MSVRFVLQCDWCHKETKSLPGQHLSMHPARLSIHDGPCIEREYSTCSPECHKALKNAIVKTADAIVATPSESRAVAA